MNVLLYIQAANLKEDDKTHTILPSRGGFLSKESLLAMLIDTQLIGLPQYTLEKVDAELDPCWSTAINTLLRHKNIKAVHHLIWKARLRPQKVGGRRLMSMLKNVVAIVPELQPGRDYLIYSMSAIDNNRYVNPAIFDTLLSDNNFFTKTGDKGRLSDYYNTGL